MEQININNKEKVEIDISSINNQEELDKLNDELNKKGHITFDIKD